MSLNQVYTKLLKQHGPQDWWPGDTPFEIMVGAVLTQNTAWINVEKAIANLKDAGALTAEVIVGTHHKRLARWLRPSGYFNIKAKRLKNFCRWYLQLGAYETLSTLETAALRAQLLSVNGVGPETADDILLYAFERPVFVVDAYTRRLFTRLGYLQGNEDYETVRALFEKKLKTDAQLFNNYHALIVSHGKDVCKTKPQCDYCCMSDTCRYQP